MKEKDSAVNSTAEVSGLKLNNIKWKNWIINQIYIYIVIIIVLHSPNNVTGGLACLSNPCINGVCIDDINSTYSCYCIDGFTGIQCQTNWDECWSSPCKNGGTCIDGIAEYNCTCPDGFIGFDCEIDFDECDSNPCQNNGTCIDASNGFSCMCSPGYSGEFCEIDIAVCNTTDDTRCFNGGQCIEGAGISFKCKCTPGWEGKLCDVPIDECKSSPCENGGICIDLFAEYTCACRFGYTGKNCEAKIELCSNSPCTNNALCIMESTIKRCYCVPDYHGEKCQYQYDECLLGPKCRNGGTCIDGIDNYTCSCPPLLTGTLCECLILEDGDLDCEYISPTPLPTEVVDFTTSQITIFNENITSTNKLDDRKYTELTETTEYTSKIFVPTTLWDQSTILTLDDKLALTSEKSYTSSSTESLMTDIDLFTDDDDRSVSKISTSSFDDTQKPIDYFTTSMTTSNLFTSEDITLSPITNTSTEFKTELYLTTDTLSNMTTKESIFNESSQTITESHELTSEEVNTVYSTIFSTTNEIINDIMGKTHHFTTSEYDLTTISNETMKATSIKLPDFTFLTQEITTIFNEYPSTQTPYKSTTITEENKYSTTGYSELDCSYITCFNGGSCIHSTEGPRCVCKFDFDGPFCEDTIGIANAAFSGDSYLTHKLYNATGMRIELKAKTLSPDGLILYANIGPETYMYIYVQKGFLKFKFSCGYQTMLLSELEMAINNGYEIKIKAILEYTDGKKHCNASLHINDTLAMSGGQISAFSMTKDSKDSWLHLGAIPEGFDVNISPDIDPFTGCMFGLQIDNKPCHIFKDASDGFEIKECSSLTCLSNPCTNGGTCNDIGEQWICNCANGYLGKYCEESICLVNPCQYGGSCAEHPGSGFLCLCPLGKHGLYCEHNLEIAQPSFSAMVGGYSSFALYQLPKSLVLQGLEMHFRIQPNNIDQISLLAFLGQSGVHDSKSDHLAVTFVKGYIMLTWNLGNGPRRIFTSRPLSLRNNRPHLIRVGRSGRTAWLAVDNMQNVTGNAPGNQLTLDVLPLLYIGGHESVNFSLLPHDLPLHGGFSGCIWDIWVGTIGSKNDMGVSWIPVRGRAVGQCSVTQCHPMICHNGGACLHHSATYSCLCPQGWFGPVCTSHYNPCDSFSNKCATGSTCVPTVTGYHCDCSLGKTGTFCEKNVTFSDISLSGIRSYIKLNKIQLGDVHFNLEIEVRPLHPKGILFYTEMQEGCFISLSLQGGLLEYRWTGVEWGTKTTSHIVAIVRSGVVLSLGSWHTIRAGRYGRKLYLWVDGTMTTEILKTHQFFTAVNASVYIGGIRDLSSLPVDVVSSHPMSFTGCVRKLVINYKRYPLNNENMIESRNADDCDGDICGGDLCWNGGTCIISKQKGISTAECVCPLPYTGPQCIEEVPCKPGGCNKGRCIQNVCVCPTGWEGHSCQNQIKISTPQFGENSYMVIEENKYKTIEKSSKYNKIRYKRNANHIYMNFTTATPSGLLLWGEINNKKILSIGLEGGYLKISWSLAKQKYRFFYSNNRNYSDMNSVNDETSVIKLLQAGRLSNGEWHTLYFKFQLGNISVITDNKVVYEENGFNYDLNMNDLILYLGGLPLNMTIKEYTKGLHSSNFIGCISEISLGIDKNPVTNFSIFESENVDSCQLIP